MDNLPKVKVMKVIKIMKATYLLGRGCKTQQRNSGCCHGLSEGGRDGPA